MSESGRGVGVVDFRCSGFERAMAPMLSVALVRITTSECGIHETGSIKRNFITRMKTLIIQLCFKD